MSGLPTAGAAYAQPLRTANPRLRVLMEPNQRFAANLRAQRERAGISQERLGFRSGLHRTEISLLERGEREPRLSTIVRVARGLKVAPADLLDGIE